VSENPRLEYLFEPDKEEIDSQETNVLEERVKNMSRKNQKRYMNTLEGPINLGNGQLIFERSVDDMFIDGEESGLVLKNIQRLNSDFFWIGSNGVVQMDGKVFALDEPALCMRLKRKDKYYKVFFFCYSSGYTSIGSSFRFSYPFDVGLEIRVRDNEAYKKRKKKEGRDFVAFLGHSFKIKKKRMAQMMRFFPKRRFLFGEFVLNGDRKLDASVSRTRDGEKKLRLLPLEGSCRNVFFEETEIDRYRESDEEEFFIDVSGNLDNVKEGGSVTVVVTIRLWFEFYLKGNIC